MSDTSPGRAKVSLLRSALSLGLIAVIGTAGLAWVHQLTESRISEQERLLLLRQLQQVVPADEFDNAMHIDFVTIRDETAFPGGQSVRVYRARKDGGPAAVVIRESAIDGYHGKINLLIGILDDGQISGVRVLDHHETPGLGDGIELERSNWILSFDDRSLDRPELQGWEVKRDGGEFDQFTGATITPRAVVHAVSRALEYYRDHHDMLFARESEFVPGDDTAEER